MNPITTLRKKQRLLALFFLTAIAASEAHAFVSTNSALAPAPVGAPVAASASDYVDPFTGDFSYSVPLLTVPGPNGENVPVTASYRAGIRMNQSASWLGLGWDYNPGEISRQVNGAPDDNNGKVNFSIYCHPEGSVISVRQENAIYGPMHYNATGTPNYSLTHGTTFFGLLQVHDKTLLSHDAFVSSNTKLTYSLGSAGYNESVRLSFYTADYDMYSISGAGLKGALQPYTNSKISLKREKSIVDGLSTTGNIIKPLQFYFARSADMTSLTIESTTNRWKTGYFVKYFTNSELNDETDNDAARFIDYREAPASGVRRPVTDFDTDGIGAYQVTTPSGMTYHYSLPVYTDDEQFISFGVNASGVANFQKRTDLQRKTYKYATSWKLTAITGPDYVDTNENNRVDMEDKGYWIAYDYSLWCNEYKWSSGLYGFRKDLQPRQWYKGIDNPRVYEPKGSVSSGSSQQYYLNKIRTATHTAFFVKSIRKDEQSMDQIYNPANAPKPQLKLDRIVLLRNEDAGLFEVAGTIAAVSGYSTSGCNPNSDLVHSGIYSVNADAINTASLKSVEFETDYSLCKKYYSNIANTCTADSLKFSASNDHNTFFADGNTNGLIIGNYKPSSVSTSTADASNLGGKLSLKKIKVYEVGKTAVYPSYEFAYHTSNNPDYDCEKTDIWGYYKSDYAVGKRSYYTTATSKDYVDAWSLESIITPLGGKIHVNYESDEYVHEGGVGYKPSFITLVDSKSTTYSVRYANEGDYLWSPVSWKTVIPNKASCTGVFYMSYENSLYSPDLYPDPLFDPSCTVYDTYDPAGGLTEWGWTRNEVAKAYGGGIRVKDINIEDPESGESYKIEYTYENGLCTYKPDKFKVEDFSLTNNQLQNERDNGSPTVGYKDVKAKNISNNGQNNGETVYLFDISYSPAKVSANLSRTDVFTEGNTYYEYQCQWDPLVPLDHERCKVRATHTHRYLALQKQVGLFGNFGQPLKKSIYDKGGALVAWTKHYYKETTETEEVFTTGDQPVPVPSARFWKTVCNSTQSQPVSPPNGMREITCTPEYRSFTNYVSHHIGQCTLKKQYAVPEKTETYSNGITTTSIINQRDPVSMQPLSSTVIDPTQGAITTIIKPAYTNTVSYSGMGLKSACSGCESNENLVSLVEEQRIVKQPVFRNTDGVLTYNSTSPGILMGASRQTYASSVYHRRYNTGTSKYESVSEAANTWLPYESYTALTSTSTPASITTPDWKKTNTVTLYTTANKALETQGMSNRKSAVKYGYNNLYPLSSISDANYNSFTFSSFEDKTDVDPGGGTVWHFGGEVINASMQSAATALITPHTGYYMAAVPASTFGPGIVLNEYEKGRTYRASVWVHKSSPATAKLTMGCDGSVGGTPAYLWAEVLKNDPNNITVGDWTLMSVQLTVPENLVESGGTHDNSFGIFLWNTGGTTAYYDDLMVRPVDSPITGTVYDPHTGRVIATLDNENFASWFEYDAAGRVISTYAETRLGIKKISETQYNFSRAGQ